MTVTPRRLARMGPAPIRRRRLALGCVALLAGCTQRSDDGPVVVSAIGGVPTLLDPSQGPLDTPSRLMLDSTAQGLVHFDAAGQVEPGIAERWSVIDNGNSYIFRLRDAEWDDGRPVTAGEVVTILRRQIARGSRNPLAPYLTAIDEIVEMTPEVIEIRLKRPRPDLLKLFAQPELALFRMRPPGGGGPFRVLPRRGRTVLLRPAFDPIRTADDDAAEPSAAAGIELIGERAARGITRFAQRDSDLVSGGTFADWPLVLATQIAPANRRFDPAVGVFGLAVVRREGVLADAANRAAIARAIDRSALVAAIARDWTATAQLLPEQLDSAALPATAAWAQPLAGGAPTPRAQIAAWRLAHPEPIVLRIALPAGPGATILFGYVGAALLSLGIQPQRVGADDAADLRLVDAVAPYDSARWYVAMACRPCSADAQAAVAAARDAPTPALRARHIAEADAALARDVAFIPLAVPLRWSLVALRLRDWTGNPRAWHPLDHLRNDPR